VCPVAEAALGEELDQVGAERDQAVARLGADLEQFGPQGHDVARGAVPVVVVGRGGVPQVGVEEGEELVLFFGWVELERDAREAGVVGSCQAGAEQLDEPGVGVL